MSVRIIGAILIIAGCSSVGFMMAYSYRREIMILSEFSDFLNFLECELQYRTPPISYVLKHFSDNRKGTLSSFFQQLSKELESQIRPSVESCITAALSKASDLPKQTQYYIKKLSQTLGRFDIEGQVLEIQALQNEVTQKLNQLRVDQNSQTKNYKTIGICAGAALAILFI